MPQLLWGRWAGAPALPALSSHADGATDLKPCPGPSLLTFLADWPPPQKSGSDPYCRLLAGATWDIFSSRVGGGVTES